MQYTRSDCCFLDRISRSFIVFSLELIIVIADLLSNNMILFTDFSYWNIACFKFKILVKIFWFLIHKLINVFSYFVS